MVGGEMRTSNVRRGNGGIRCAVVPLILTLWTGTPAPAVGQDTGPGISVVYFDLGNTLVMRAPGESRRVWIPGAREALTQLHASGIRLGVLSNTGNLSWDEVLSRILPEDFDPTLFDPALIVVSSAVEAPKPDPRIFQFAIDQTGVTPAEILFITETMDHVFAAQAQGMRALYVSEGGLTQLVDDFLAWQKKSDG